MISKHVSGEETRGLQTKDLDRRILVHTADSIEDSVPGAATDRRASDVVSQKNEDVDRLVEVNSSLEPVLLNHGSSGDDLGNVGVASEVIQDAKSHDTDT